MRREKRPLYRAYLLRCWQEGEAAPGEEPRCRFSVEEILHKRRRKGFDNLEALLDFLRAELGNEAMNNEAMNNETMNNEQ